MQEYLCENIYVKFKFFYVGIFHYLIYLELLPFVLHKLKIYSVLFQVSKGYFYKKNEI